MGISIKVKIQIFLYVDIPIDSQPMILGPMLKRWMEVAEVKLHSWTLINFTGDELH